MPGIRAINERSTRTSSERGTSSNRRELYFRDGDQAFLIPVATGEDNDPYLDEFWMYTFQDGGSFRSVLEGPNGPMGKIPEGTRASHRFAFWAYVIEVFHGSNPNNNDRWEAVTGPSGKTVYKEEINDFRVIALSMGRSNALWNQLVDVYNDWGTLNKGVVRIRRQGAGLDTTYTITATPKEDEISESKYSEVNDLPSIKDYMLDIYSDTPSEPNQETVPTSSISLDDDEDGWETEKLPF